MGTRSATRVWDEAGNLLVIIYGQHDGYPTGVGADIKESVGGHVVVNGISGNEPRPFANGMGCLAAQLIVDLKTDVGGIYIVPASFEAEWVDFVYDLRCERAEIAGPPVRPRLTVTSGERVIYEGALGDFDPKKVEREAFGGGEDGEE